MFDLYRKSVKIGYDPTEGMIDMEVIAPDPRQSQEFSLALIAYAEEQVDQMTSRLRDDQMEGAIAIYQDAEAKVLAPLTVGLGIVGPDWRGSPWTGHSFGLVGPWLDRYPCGCGFRK